MPFPDPSHLSLSDLKGPCVPEILVHFLFIYFSVFISLETSSLTYGLFTGVFFSVQGFGDFPVNFLFSSSSLIPLWSENALFDFNSFKCLEVCSIAQDVVCLAV